VGIILIRKLLGKVRGGERLGGALLQGGGGGKTEKAKIYER